MGPVTPVSNDRIINVVERKVEVYFDPTSNGYKFRAEYLAGE
jgi:hypothetical protein